MTSEQFTKLYDLLTGIMVMSSLSLVVLVLIGALVFGYIYTKKTYLDDLKRENKRKEDIIQKLDRSVLVSTDYIQYLVAKEQKKKEMNL